MMDIKVEDVKATAEGAENSVHADTFGASVQAAQLYDSKATDGQQRSFDDDDDRIDQQVMLAAVSYLHLQDLRAW